MKKLFKPFIYGCIAAAGSINTTQAPNLVMAPNNVKDNQLTMAFATDNTNVKNPVTQVSTKVI